MGGYNEVGLPNWQNLVRRVFGLSGAGGNVPVLAPEIQPVAILQPDNAEYRRLRGDQLWAAGDDRTGGLTANVVAIVNPAGSGRLVVIEWLEARASGAAASQFAVRIDTQTNVEALANTVTAIRHAPRDSRMIVPGGGIPAAVLRFGNAAASTGFVLGFGLNVSAFPDFPITVESVVLTPGFGVLAQNETAGQRIQWLLRWYERILETSEETG